MASPDFLLQSSPSFVLPNHLAYSPWLGDYLVCAPQFHPIFLLHQSSTTPLHLMDEVEFVTAIVRRKDKWLLTTPPRILAMAGRWSAGRRSFSPPRIVKIDGRSCRWPLLGSFSVSLPRALWCSLILPSR
jgi:hypothetical protein